MKKQLFLLLSLLPFLAAAQKSYTISGSLPAIKGKGNVYLILLKNTSWNEIVTGLKKGTWKDVDSAQIKGGEFYFSGSLEEPQQALLAINHDLSAGSKWLDSLKDFQSFYIENSEMSVQGTDSVRTAKITGSVADVEDRELKSLIRPLENQYVKLYNVLSIKKATGASAATPDELQKTGTEMVKLQDQIRDIKVKFVESHLNSFIGLSTFNSTVLAGDFEPAKGEAFFRRFPTELRSSPLGSRIADNIASAKRRQVGVKASDFIQNDVNGRPFKLSSLKGKYVLVDFWASWCVPCRAENPNLLKAYTQFKSKNFEIVGVSVDSDKTAWLAAVKQDGMPWIQLSDLKGGKNEVAMLYNITTVPQNLLISPEGVIIAKNLRGEDLPEKLAKFIK